MNLINNKVEMMNVINIKIVNVLNANNKLNINMEELKNVLKIKIKIVHVRNVVYNKINI